MRFRQLDKIVALEPGVAITAERTLSDRDRFFDDHFPQFPILPGVLSLEAMSQASDWLLRKSDDFARSVVVLKEARNVKYSGFAQPGQKLTITAQLKKLDDRFAKFAARVTVDDRVTANARLVLERFDLAERYPARAPTDPLLRIDKLEQFDVLDPKSPNHHPVPPTSYRWMWVDRFTEFVSGRRASAIKTVSLTDETVDLYMPGFPVMPCSVIVEGLAQTGGILVSELKKYEKEVVLAKVSKAVFHRPALPGDTMAYSAEIADVHPEGAIVHGTSHIGDELHAEFELFFAYLSGRLSELELIRPDELLGMLRLYSLYDVAQTEEGDPLDVPKPLLDAEREKISAGGKED